MVDLGNGYFVIPTNYGYNLVEDKGVKDKKTGKPCYDTISYHGSLAAAINAAMQELQRERLSDRIYTLEEAIEIIVQTQKHFEDILKEAVYKNEYLKGK